MEIPSSSVVSRQTYDAATLAGPLSNQMAALKAAGAQVVVMATIPAATALAMLPAAVIGYFPQYVVDNVGADSPTVGPLLASFTQKGGGSAAQATAAGGSAERGHHRRLLRPRVGHVQPVGAGREEAPRRSTRRRSTPSPGSTATPSTASRWPTPSSRRSQKAGKNLDPAGPARRHQQPREELRDPGLRAARPTRARCTTASRVRRSSSSRARPRRP